MSDDLKQSSATNPASAQEDKQLDTPLATIREVFSFAETPKTRLYLVLGLFWAVVAGLALPASLFYFSRVMGNIAAIGEEGLGPVLEIIYAMMIVGLVSLISETLQSEFLV
jgi:hypothetical protein